MKVWAIYKHHQGTVTLLGVVLHEEVAQEYIENHIQTFYEEVPIL